MLKQVVMVEMEEVTSVVLVAQVVAAVLQAVRCREMAGAVAVIIIQVETVPLAVLAAERVNQQVVVEAFQQVME